MSSLEVCAWCEVEGALWALRYWDCEARESQCHGQNKKLGVYCLQNGSRRKLLKKQWHDMKFVFRAGAHRHLRPNTIRACYGAGPKGDRPAVHKKFQAAKWDLLFPIRSSWGRDNVHNVVHCTDLPEELHETCQGSFLKCWIIVLLSWYLSIPSISLLTFIPVGVFANITKGHSLFWQSGLRLGQAGDLRWLQGSAADL